MGGQVQRLCLRARTVYYRQRGNAERRHALDNLIFLLLLGILGTTLSWAGVRMIRNYAISRQLSTTGPEGKLQTPRGGGLAILVVVLLIFMPMGLSMAESEPSQVVRFAFIGAFI